MCVCACVYTCTYTCECMCAISFTLHQREKPISEKSWNGSTVQNQRRQFHWRLRERAKKKVEEKRKGRQRNEEKQGGGHAKRETEQEISQDALRERRGVLLVSELSLYSRLPLWSYSREQSTSPSDLASCQSWNTHARARAHARTHLSAKRTVSLSMPCVALNDTDVYASVHVCTHLIIHPSPPTSLPFALLHPPPPPTQTACQQLATKTQKFQKTSRHLSPSLHLLPFYSPTHTATQKQIVSWG